MRGPELLFNVHTKAAYKMEFAYEESLWKFLVTSEEI